MAMLMVVAMNKRRRERNNEGWWPAASPGREEAPETRRMTSISPSMNLVLKKAVVHEMARGPALMVASGPLPIL